ELVEVRVDRLTLQGPLQTELTGLPRGVTARAVGAQGGDVALWELTAGPEAELGETPVTVLARIGESRGEGRFKLAVVPPVVPERPAAFGPGLPRIEGRWQIEGDELAQQGDGVGTLPFPDPPRTHSTARLPVPPRHP